MRMQFCLLKCSNYLNIHQAGKQRQSEFPLLKCYNMGLGRWGGRGWEAAIQSAERALQKEI